MPRRLDVVRDLFRELRAPCPVDMLGLPRVAGGFDCAECGRVVIDVAGLTFEEAVEFRRRAQSGGERLCGAYTLDRDSRVLLRAAPTSSKVVAIAVSALLAACETGARPTTESAPSASAHSAREVPATPNAVAAVVTAVAPPTAAPQSTAAIHEAKAAEPECAKAAGSAARRSPSHKARSKNDPEVLGGY